MARDEKREALDLWGAHLERLTNGEMVELLVA